MQKARPAISPGLLCGLLISLLLHAGVFAYRENHAPATINLETGTIAVELTLMPSIASIPQPDPVSPPPEESVQQEILPEPIEERIEEPPLIPVINTPETMIQEDISETTKPEPPDPEEPVETELVNTVESFDQIGSLETDKGVDTEASFKNGFKLRYPPLSQRRGETGTVIFSIEISAEGKPTKIECIQSSGFSRLDKAALKSLKKASYIPAERNGKPVASTRIQHCTYELSND